MPRQTPYDTSKFPKPEPGKLYIRLFHGRHTPDEELQDWGFDGPWIGPLNFVHGVYLQTLFIEFASKEAAEAFDFDQFDSELKVVSDMIEFDGKFYGDFSVCLYDPERNNRPSRMA